MMCVNVRKYIKREYIGPVIRFLIRTITVVVAILLMNVIGLGAFLLFSGQLHALNFSESLFILLVLEGALIGGAGGFMFIGLSESGIVRQAAINPAIASDQRQRWRERRLSQEKWGMAMLIAGVLLILLGLSISFLTSL